jgi:hypothetical protein
VQKGLRVHKEIEDPKELKVHRVPLDIPVLKVR